MSRSRMIAVVVMSVVYGQGLPNVGLAAEKLVKVVAKSAKAFQPKQAGGKTVEVEAVLTVTNGGDGVAGVSPRQFGYALVPKGADGKEGEPQMFFGIKDPELADTQPLGPGKSVDLSATLEGHTIEVAKGAKYVLIVTDSSDAKNSQRIEITIK